MRPGLEFTGDGDGVIMLCEPAGKTGFGVLVVVEMGEPVPVGEGDGLDVAIGEVLVQVCGEVQGFRGHGLLLSFVLFFLFIL